MQVSIIGIAVIAASVQFIRGFQFVFYGFSIFATDGCPECGVTCCHSRDVTQPLPARGRASVGVILQPELPPSVACG